MKSVDVVEVAVPGLGHSRQAAVEYARHPGPAPLDHRVPHGADAIGVGDGDGIEQAPIVVDPRRAGHLSVAVEAEPAGKHLREVAGAAGKDGGYSGSDRPGSDPQLTRAGDQRGVPDGHAGNIGDGIEWSRGAIQGDAQVAGRTGVCAWPMPAIRHSIPAARNILKRVISSGASERRSTPRPPGTARPRDSRA